MLIKRHVFLAIIAFVLAGCQISMPSFTSLPIQKAEKECVSVQTKLPLGFIASGKILLGDFSETAANGKIMALTPDVNKPFYMPDVPMFSGGSTSPDGKLFAYVTVGKDYSSTLVVLDENGKEIFTLPWDEKWGGFYWLNSQQLEFPFFWDDNWQNAPPMSDIINVLTGKQETISPQLSDPWIPGGPQVPLLVMWKTTYNPSLSIVGYIRGSEPDQSFVLWDLKNNHELWKLDKWSTRTVRPAWTPDGKKLAIVVLNQKEDNWDHFELYLVNTDGQAEKWIDIRGYYKDAAININWSPNGRYLAIAPNENQPLLILDTTARKLLDYCIPSYVGYGNAIWSADSSQMIVPRQSDSEYRSIVLNLKDKQAAYVADNPKFIPIGWLSTSP